MSLVDDKPRSATATALKPTTCIVIKEHEFKQRPSRTDPFMRGLLRVLTRNIRHTNRMVTEGPRA